MFLMGFYRISWWKVVVLASNFGVIAAWRWGIFGKTYLNGGLANNKCIQRCLGAVSTNQNGALLFESI